jgi:hypothetical protein
MEKCCQSCGLPFNAEHTHFIAKDPDGTDSMYCTMCYKDGKFINPDMSFDEMIEIQVPILLHIFGSEEAVRKELRAFLPTLERWKNKK